MRYAFSWMSWEVEGSLTDLSIMYKLMSKGKERDDDDDYWLNGDETCIAFPLYEY